VVEILKVPKDNPIQVIARFPASPYRNILGQRRRRRGPGPEGIRKKVSKEMLAEHRAAMIWPAGRLFRERGIDGVGAAEMVQTGLTAEAIKDDMAASNA
jgi:hypothetical protein